MNKENNEFVPPGKKRTNSENIEHNTNEEKVNKPEKTEIDYDTIKKLPLRAVNFGKGVIKGYYDEENLIVHLADSDGQLIGKKAKLTKPLPPIKEDSDDIDEDSGDNEQDNLQNKVEEMAKSIYNKTTEIATRKENDSSNSSSDKKKNKNKGKGKGKFLLLVVVFFTVVIGLVVGFKIITPKLQSLVEVKPVEGQIMVIEVNRDIIPGDEITEDCLQAANIDGQTYNQIALNGNDLYRWEQKDNILGMYATEYISDGHYVTTDAVTKIFKEPTNPWEIDNEKYDYVDVPIDILEYDRTKVLIGSKATLEFNTEKHEDSKSETVPSEYNGLKVTATNTVVDTKSYYIENVVIANILTTNGANLFNQYSSLIKIPEGSQEHYLKTAMKENKEYLSLITPAKIRVILDKDFAALLKRAVSQGTTVTVEILDDKDVSSTEKEDFYGKQEALMNNIASLLK